MIMWDGGELMGLGAGEPPFECKYGSFEAGRRGIEGECGRDVGHD